MVFNQYYLDYLSKVRSQAYLYGLKHSLRPSGEPRQRPTQLWLWGGDWTLNYDLENAVSLMVQP
jgi:hypothetical protein